ncbi:response regulator transcription factor [Streptomyces sp. NPDC021212]|uniref:response regulator transcription factor n=1 Tax=Streptomyces sp. NPDC021212 TaxID=3365118 RepID=UPI0037947F40
MTSAECVCGDVECTAEELRKQAEELFLSGHADDALAMLYKAASPQEGARRSSRALLLERLGRYLNAASSSWHHDYFERSLVELDQDESYDTRVQVLCSVGVAFVCQGRAGEGMALLDEALGLVQDSGDTVWDATVGTAMTEALLVLGRLDDCLIHLRRARYLAIESTRHQLVIRSYVNEARVTYLQTGNVCDAMRIRKVGLRYATDVGELATEEGNTVRLGLIKDLIEMGQWPEALQLFEPDEGLEPSSRNDVEEQLVRCWLHSCRGQPAEMMSRFGEIITSSSPFYQAYFLSLGLATACRLKDYATVEELTGRALRLAQGPVAPPISRLYIIDALASVIEAQSNLDHALLHSDTAPQQLLSIMERIHLEERHRVPAELELTDGVVAEARAHCAEPQDAAVHWDRAIVVFRRTHARARLVTALLGRAAHRAPGDTDTRRALLLDEAERIARQMCATPHLERITQLRSREAEPASAPAPVTLTARQLEVVALLAEGRTDREIAGSLRISVRTVNAHVVQILTRLDVRNRAEAAAWFIHAGPLRDGPMAGN